MAGMCQAMHGKETPTIRTLTEPTPVQRKAFELIGQPVPLTLKQTEEEAPETVKSPPRAGISRVTTNVTSV